MLAKLGQAAAQKGRACIERNRAHHAVGGAQFQLLVRKILREANLLPIFLVNADGVERSRHAKACVPAGVLDITQARVPRHAVGNARGVHILYLYHTLRAVDFAQRDQDLHTPLHCLAIFALKHILLMLCQMHVNNLQLLHLLG